MVVQKEKSGDHQKKTKKHLVMLLMQNKQGIALESSWVSLITYNGYLSDSHY